MAFEGLKEKLRDSWADLSSKIQENSTFNNLREKFEEQSPPAQKAIVAGGVAILALILLSFPYGYLSESQTNMEIFESNRTLIQGLLRASRAAKEPSPLPPPMPPEALKSRLDAVLKENRLVPEQIGESANLPDRPAKDLAPPAVTQTGLAMQIKKLNLQQVINLGHAFQNLGPGIKFVGVDIVQSAEQTHYYDIVARVVSFALPQMSFESDSGSGGKGKGGKSPPRPKADAAPKPTEELEE